MHLIDGTTSVVSSEPDRARVKLPRVARARFAVAFAAVVVFVGAAGFISGTLIPRPEGSQGLESSVPAPVTAAVETRVVTERTSVSGVVEPGAVTEVRLMDTADGGDIPYVTEAGPKAGEQIDNGSVLVAVAGRPRIALQVTSPLYRDLRVGDEGADVFAFEIALSQLVGGDFDVDQLFTPNTMEAAESLWQDLGYELPTEAAAQTAPISTPIPTQIPAPAHTPDTISETAAPYVEVHELVQLPGPSATVITNAKVGDLAVADKPIASLATTMSIVRGRVTLINEDEFPAGTQVQLTAPGLHDGVGTVQRVGDFEVPSEAETDGSSKNPAGRDLEVTLPDEWKSVPAGTRVQISSQVVGAEVLAVPLSAIRGGADEPHVIVESSATISPGSSLPVTVLAAGDGWVQINDDSGLLPGDLLRLAP